MPTPSELAVEHTSLEASELEHLQRLLGSWQVLADLAFSDLILLAPVEEDEPGTTMVVLGQMRPSNRPTAIEQDLVGKLVEAKEWVLAAAAFSKGRTVRSTVVHPTIGESVSVENIPVRFEGEVIAVLVRVALPPQWGPMSLYEKTYLEVFDRLAAMVAESAFPFPEEDVGTEEAPRVGDGFVVVDAEGRVEFASPNAMNAFHRMGLYSTPEGRRFTELGVEESAVEWALATARPVVEEVERRPDVVVLVHCIPLVAEEVVTGAMILLRDVTDVRRLDRLLLSKDAAIREVHHRVKNNLQTISSLLSLQARRVPAGSGREELREAERRVRSIALVHEILSRDPGDQVPFGDIVDSLVEMAEDSVMSTSRVEIVVTGDVGDLAADMATPLAVVLAEVLQNAVEHAFGPSWAPDGAGTSRTGGAAELTGQVAVFVRDSGGELTLEVEDNGCGLPQGFDIESTTSLGLSIVRDLVTSQLDGSISMGPVPEGTGTRVKVTVPLRDR